MREQNSRYTEFGNSIISRYCGFDTYYDPIALLFLKVSDETQEEESAPQYTNIYQLWYLKEENHIYEKNLTFLTNLLEKNIHNHAAYSIEQQVNSIIHDRLPQIHSLIVKQMTNETVGLFRYEKKESRREEVLTRMLEEKYKLEKKAAKELYRSLKETVLPHLGTRPNSNRTQWNIYETQNNDYHSRNQNFNRNESFRLNIYDNKSLLENRLVKQDFTEVLNQWLNEERRNVTVKNEWNHYELFPHVFQSKYTKFFQTKAKKDIKEPPVYKEYFNQPLQYMDIMNNHMVEEYHSYDGSNHLWNQYDRGRYNIDWEEVFHTNVTENISYKNMKNTSYIEQINKLVLPKMEETHKKWVEFGQREILKKNINEMNHLTQYLKSIHLQSLYQNNTELQNISNTEIIESNRTEYKNNIVNQTNRSIEIIREEVTGNKSDRPNINQIQWRKAEKPLEFYNYWINRYQNVYKNGNNWYRNEGSFSPTYLTQMNIEQQETVEGEVVETRNYTENINQIQWMKTENPMKFYSHWMKQYQNVYKNENSWYRNESSFSPTYLSQINVEQRETVDGEVVENKNYTENINQIQWMKTENPLKFYSHWMKQYHNVYKNENSWYRNENPFSPSYLTQQTNITQGDTKQTEITERKVTENKSYVENINQIQQTKIENPLKFYSQWMKQSHIVNKNENHWNKIESSFSPAYLSQVNINQTERAEREVIENKSYVENINQIQQTKIENPLEFYSQWMKQYHIANKNENSFHINNNNWNVNENSWYRNENSSSPTYLTQISNDSNNDYIEQLELTKKEVIENKSYIENINQMQRAKMENPRAFYESFTKMIDRELPMIQQEIPGIRLEQRIRDSEVRLVYGTDEKGQEAEKNRKNQKQVMETQKQIIEELEFVKETRHEVELLSQTYQQWERKQKKAEEETIRLNSEQGKRYVEQEAERIFGRQLNESIDQITSKVYRKLESTLRSERNRRGII